MFVILKNFLMFFFEFWFKNISFILMRLNVKLLIGFFFFILNSCLFLVYWCVFKIIFFLFGLCLLYVMKKKE